MQDRFFIRRRLELLMSFRYVEIIHGVYLVCLSSFMSK